MMFRKLTLALLAFVFVLSACSSPVGGGAGLTDGLGRTVKLSQPAQHIVSLAPSNTEILFAIGAGQQVAGRDMFSDYPEAAKSLPDIGGSMGEFSPQQNVALSTDPFLAAGPHKPEHVHASLKLWPSGYY